MLAWRVLLSAIMIPALFAVFYIDSHLGDAAPLLLLFVILLSVRGAYEMAVLLRTRSFAPHWQMTAACSAATVAAGWCPPERLAAVTIVLALCIILLFVSAAIRYREPGRTMETLAAETLIVGYVGILLSVTAQLRWIVGGEAGYLVLGSLVIATKGGDIGAYTLGRLFGKRKLVPHLSPGKTWMGAWGALIGAAGTAWAWLHFATPWFNSQWQPPHWYWALAYGAIVGFTGMVGDLCESLIKRDVGQKDSAALLPAFGGLLDLLDSVILSGPIAWLCWRFLPLATWQ